ncbi:DUF6213 family protein [Streptomyces sp. NPDC002990]
MMNVSVPLAPSPTGHLLVPADQVTGLLRRLAGEWLRTTDETDLDPETVLALAGVLNVLADQLDVECIAFMPTQTEEVV